MEEETSSPKAIASLIPGLYYDVIARVSAGVPFLIILFWNKTADLHTDNFGQIGSGLVVLGAGYIVGLLMTALSSSVGSAIPILLRGGNKKRALVEYLSSIRAIKIAEQNPEAGIVLSKMHAELVLTRNLFVGYLVLLVIQYSGAGSISAFSVLNTTSQEIIFVILVFAAVHRQMSYSMRIVAYEAVFLEKDIWSS